jgi:5-methylcytosine-specific restriction endonuclease McrA
MPLADPDAQREYSVQYRAAHREDAKARAAAWRLAHPGYRPAQRDTAEYKQQAAQRSKEWRDTHPGYNAEYHEAHKGEIRKRHVKTDAARYAGDKRPFYARNHKHRAAKRDAFVAPVDDAEVWERCKGICHICGLDVDPSLRFPDPHSRSLDHIVPLTRGGKHEPANVALAHFGCNAAKGNRLLKGA